METKAQRIVNLTIVPREPNGSSLDATDVVVLLLVEVVVVKGPVPMFALLSKRETSNHQTKDVEVPIKNSNLKHQNTATFQHFKPQQKTKQDASFDCCTGTLHLHTTFPVNRRTRHLNEGFSMTGTMDP